MAHKFCSHEATDISKKDKKMFQNFRLKPKKGKSELKIVYFVPIESEIFFKCRDKNYELFTATNV